MNCELCQRLLTKQQIWKKCRFCSFSCSAKFHKPFGKSGRKKKYNPVKCPECFKEFHVCPSVLKSRKNGIKFCSQSCKCLHMAKNKTPWGFRTHSKRMSANPYPRKQIDGIRITEHRRVMQEFLGRKLERWEHVHHKNGNPNDNSIENLCVLHSSQHGMIHYIDRKDNPV